MKWGVYKDLVSLAGLDLLSTDFDNIATSLVVLPSLSAGYPGVKVWQ